MAAIKLEPTVVASAVFSSDDNKTYRYVATRRWKETGPMRLWIMCNPSIADELVNDPTVERCQIRSQEDGYAGMVVCNIFALVSTDPRALRRHEDPIGPENDAYIDKEVQKADQVVCAWGTHGTIKNRGPEVLQRLLKAGVEVNVLKLTKFGHPQHPLYLPYDLKPQPIFSEART